MSEELNEGTEPQAVEPEVTEQTTESPAGEEATPKEAEQPTNGYEKRIATLTARNFNAKQELDQAQAEIATLKAVRETPKDVVIPELPSEDLRFEDEPKYRKGVEDYHKNVAAQALRDAQKDQEANRVASEKQQAAAATQERHRGIVTQYVDGGIKAGISEVKMQANEQILAAQQLSPELAEFIYSDPDGAKIVDYLADNPEKIQALRESVGGHAYVKLATEIKPQALSTKPAHTNAPDPINPTRGAGSAPTEGLSPLLAGATFE